MLQTKSLQRSLSIGWKKKGKEKEKQKLSKKWETSKLYKKKKTFYVTGYSYMYTGGKAEPRTTQPPDYIKENYTWQGCNLEI